MWAILIREVLKLKPQPYNSDELFNILVDAREAIDPQVIRNLTSKMRKQMNELKDKNRGHTKYYMYSLVTVYYATFWHFV